LITLPHGVIDRLKAVRGPGENYSDMIIRVTRGEGDALERRQNLWQRAKMTNASKPRRVQRPVAALHNPFGAASSNYTG
jgi:hypothetical protein